LCRFTRSLALLALPSLMLTPGVMPLRTAHASPVALQPVIVTIPLTNGDNYQRAVSDSVLLYTLSNPRTVPHPCTSCGKPPFMNFTVDFCISNLTWQNKKLSATSPRLLFAESKGVDTATYSVLGGWLVYLRYHSYDVLGGGGWTLVARNLYSAKIITLDESTKAAFPPPAGVSSDGRLVVWAATKQGRIGTTSVLRTFNLVTGIRHDVLQGGSPQTFSYSDVSVSGNRVAYQRNDYVHHRAQVMVFNLATRQTHLLSLKNQSGSEPSLSGSLVTWKNGASGATGTGVNVLNLQTQSRVRLPGYDTEAPRAVAGRYIIYPSRSRTNETDGHLYIYDAQTKITSTLAQRHGAWNVGSFPRAGGHTVVIESGKVPASPTSPSTGNRLLLVRLP
jgi:hypothetical protein